MDHDDVEREGYTIYRWNICTGGKFVFQSNTPTVFFPCAHPVYFAFSSLCNPIFIQMGITCSSHYHVLSGLHGFYLGVYKLPSSFNSYTQLVNFLKKKKNSQLQLTCIYSAWYFRSKLWFPYFGQESNSFNFFIYFIYTCTWIRTNVYARTCEFAILHTCIDSSRKLSLNTVYGPWEETIRDFNQI